MLGWNRLVDPIHRPAHKQKYEVYLLTLQNCIMEKLA
mgnify:CR=1 FL=1